MKNFLIGFIPASMLILGPYLFADYMIKKNERKGIYTYCNCKEHRRETNAS